jgi:hypothetical protein
MANSITCSRCGFEGEKPIHSDLHFLCKSCHARIGNLTFRSYKKKGVV